MDSTPISVIRIHEDGSVDCLKCGDTRLIVIDERERHDQVYECGLEVDANFVADLIGGAAICTMYNPRTAIGARVYAAANGNQRHLRLVE
jgi:hypothetical protein